MRAAEVAKERVKDVKEYLKEGDNIDVKIINYDKKNRMINVSIKALEESIENGEDQLAGTDEVSSNSPTLGDLLKEQMDGDKE